MTERETLITPACKAWRDDLPVHPACEIIPTYDDSKLIELGRDIKASGIKVPIIVLVQPDGSHALLDGRSRLDALVHVGIKFTIKIVDGHVVIVAPDCNIPAPTEIPSDETFNPYAFVLSTNLHRRHLKTTDKRAITKKVICAQSNLSDRAIARMTGVDKNTVKALRLEIKANGEIPHNTDRVEATGRKARGRKPDVSVTERKAQHAALFAEPEDPVAPESEGAGADQHHHLGDDQHDDVGTDHDDHHGNVAPDVALQPTETNLRSKKKSPFENTIDTPVDVISATRTTNKPSVTPIATGAKPAVAPNAFAEILAAAHRVLEVLHRPVSAPNNEAAQKETRRLINLILAHKSLKPTAPAKAA